ncbi:uncharacterized protein LOC114731223 [Neltuma alba]|uniref:uncharacterized protein LOC114731223 n=1 Tax=Neltuma alba TaxID=207710 RepID=UPI0010A4B9EA|nr:uncharacterized protein LOC114731223 [Prosopis alba]XP_028774201.1 uncharacterized protein LOC114731223 [Prosopis alba]XP_028774210.1 uncharacterized protein LOC114731223 [Prosopis alba]
MWVYPENKTFNPAVIPVRNILPIIQGKFEHPCCTWKVTPPQIKDLWFREWAKQFKWLPQHEVAIRRNWNLKCAEIIRHTMHNVRKDLFLKQMRPNWIPPNVMDDLEEIWTSENYKSKYNTAKVNRASSTGGTQHKGGSIPNTEHRRRLALQLGRNPTQYELFTKTHFDVKTNQFVDIRSAEVSEHYMRIKASKSSSVGSPSVEESNQLDGEEMRIWLQAAGGKNKKGRIYGLGSDAQHNDCTQHSSHMSPPSINTEGQLDLQNIVSELKQENEDLRQLNVTILSRLEALERKFSTGSPINSSTQSEASPHNDN